VTIAPLTSESSDINFCDEYVQGEFQSKQGARAPSSGTIYMSTGALESAIVYRLPVKIS